MHLLKLRQAWFFRQFLDLDESDLAGLPLTLTPTLLRLLFTLENLENLPLGKPEF